MKIKILNHGGFDCLEHVRFPIIVEGRRDRGLYVVDKAQFDKKGITIHLSCLSFCVGDEAIGEDEANIIDPSKCRYRIFSADDKPSLKNVEFPIVVDGVVWDGRHLGYLNGIEVSADEFGINEDDAIDCGDACRDGFIFFNDYEYEVIYEN